MTTPIDLALVELRCKLRGWKSYRLNAGEDGDTIAVECKYGGLVGFDADGQRTYEEAWNTPAHKRIEALLTAPRWTLERLLSEPPEGWRFERCPCGNVGHPGWLHWGEEIRRPFDTQNALHEVTLEVVVGESGVTTKPFVAASRHQGRLAEAFKAAAELALILAEVEP